MRVPAPNLGVQDCQSAVSESSDDAMLLPFFVSLQLMGAQWLSGIVLEPVTYIRLTRNSNKIPILNSNHTVVFLTQVNEGNSISFIYTIGFYRCFGIHSVISLLFT